jgi:hypothetical protein
MVNIVQDPNENGKFVLTLSVTLYLDRLLSDVLSEEVSQAVREQARKDIRSNKAVKREIASAATRLLLGMLGQAVGGTDTPEASQLPETLSQGQSSNG